MKSLLLILSLSLMTSAQASPVHSSSIGECKSGDRDFTVTITRSSRGGAFYADLQDADVRGPAWQMYGERKVFLSSKAVLSRVQSGVLNGCYKFSATRKDFSNPGMGLPLWEMFVCISAESGEDIAFFNATQFQPFKDKLLCNRGLFKSLGILTH